MKKRRILYILALLALFISHVFTAAYSVLVIILLLILLPCISGICTYILRDKISIKIDDIPETLIRGEKMKIRQVIRNESYLPVSNIYIKTTYKYNNNCADVSEYINVAVKADEKSIINKAVRLNYVGELSVSTKGSYIADPLKLFKFSLSECDEKKVLVLPVLNEPDSYALYNFFDDLQDSNEYSKKRKGDDTSEIFDVRGYINGDSLNRVHWMLSAKEDELLVKEFSMPISRSNCILLEINNPKTEEDRKNLNGIYEMVYAIGNLACLKEKEFKLAFYSRESDELKVIDVISYEELTEAIRLLIKEEAYEGSKSLENYMASELMGLEKLFYVSDRFDEKIFELEDVLRGQAYIYVVNGSQEAGMITRLVQSTVINVDRNDIAFGLSNTTM